MLLAFLRGNANIFLSLPFPLMTFTFEAYNVSSLGGTGRTGLRKGKGKKKKKTK